MEHLYTLKEVAETLRVNYWTVYRWVKEGKVKTVRAGRKYYITQGMLDELLAPSKEA